MFFFFHSFFLSFSGYLLTFRPPENPFFRHFISCASADVPYANTRDHSTFDLNKTPPPSPSPLTNDDVADLHEEQPPTMVVCVACVKHFLENPLSEKGYKKFLTNFTLAITDENVKYLVEFLEVAITSIIFLKGIYPDGAFERRRYMNLVVHRARHPQLNHYIQHSLNSLVPHIQQGLVERVAVIFFNRDKIPIEKFMFKINVNQSYESVIEDADLGVSLRAFLTKLSQSEPLSKAVSKDWKWEIMSYFRSIPSTSEDADMWAGTRTQQWQQPPLITPIKSMNIDPLSVQLYIEHPSLLEPNP